MSRLLCCHIFFHPVTHPLRVKLLVWPCPTGGGMMHVWTVTSKGKTGHIDANPFISCEHAVCRCPILQTLRRSQFACWFRQPLWWSFHWYWHWYMLFRPYFLKSVSLPWTIGRPIKNAIKVSSYNFLVLENIKLIFSELYF